MKICVIGLAAALVASGCASGRLADLQDCGRISVGFGVGLGCHASLGVLGNPSIGIASHKQMLGSENRNIAGKWTETEIYWPASSALILAWGGGDGMSGGNLGGRIFFPYGRYLKSARRHDDGTPLSPSRVRRERNFILDTGVRTEPPTSLFNAATDLEVGVTLGIISARVGLNPLEIIDFILGFVGIDIANDDPKREKSVEKPTTESTPTK